jgi:hypothetical protein
LGIEPDYKVGGEIGPGPKYLVNENINFPTTPKISIGKETRVTLGKQVSYDHYSHKDLVSDAIQAKMNTLGYGGAVKIGTEKRDGSKSTIVSPGPAYLITEKSEIPRTPKYTIGCRRNLPGTSGLENAVSTPRIVGPGRYIPEASSRLSSTLRKPAEVSFTK